MKKLYRYTDFEHRAEIKKAFNAVLLSVPERKSLRAVAFLLPAVIGLFVIGSLSAAKAQTRESLCFDNVQGQIAWDYQGSRLWSDTNVRNLCRGTIRPYQPGQCFNRAMHGGINWGGGTQWQWQNALNLCAGTNDADGTIACFQSKISQGIAWPEAIRACNESRCFNLVQGRVAWNYQGSRAWSDINVLNLCRGASNPTQPGQCFNRAMHGGINWGGGTQWQWQNALNLCAGTNDADGTIACFQSKISQGISWPEAIRACKSSGR
jgi:hypothetical protein